MPTRKGAQTNSQSKRSPSKALSQSYYEALKSYWNGDLDQSKALLVTNLFDDQGSDNTFCLYRLWIEILTVEKDEGGLKLLHRHLNDQSSNIPTFSDLYYALMAIIHIESDEIEEASVLLASLVNTTDNIYKAEAELRIEARRGSQLPKSPLVKNIDWLYDYIQMEKISTVLWEFEKKAALKRLTDRVTSLFPDAPLMSKVLISTAISKSQWTKAAKLAEELYARFPNNRESLLIYSAAAASVSDNQNAIFSLERLAGKSSDPDVLCLLSYCYQQRYFETGSESDFQLAKEYLEQTIQIQTQLGFVSLFASTVRARMTLMDKNEQPAKPAKVWMVQINAKSFHQIRTEFNPGKLVRKPLGNSIEKGDICIFVYEDKMRREYEDGVSWRFAAVASVVEDAEWHPYFRYQTQLKVEMIPAVAIPLDIKLDDRADPLSFDQADPRRYRAFQLDNQALAIIDEGLSYFSEEAEAFSQTMSELRQAQ